MRAAFPHLGLTKHTPWRLVPPSLPLCLSHPSPPFPSRPVCLCLCALCEPLSLLITITVHPLSPQVGEYNSIFLCALGNLYNSILNLNETIKNMLEKQLQREIHEEQHQRYCKIRKGEIYLSVFVVCFQLFLLVFLEAILKL